MSCYLCDVPRIRVLAIDDNLAYLAALATLLSEHPDIELVGTAETAESGLRMVGELAPDVILLDLVLPDQPGLELGHELGRAHPRSRIIVLSSHDSPSYREAALELGAVFVHKHGAHGLPDAIRAQATRNPRRDSTLPETLFRQIAETIEEVFWLTDVEKNRMIYVSPAYERIWGKSCQSLYDEPRSWLESIHPEDRARVLDAALHGQASGAYDVDYRILRPDGSERWIHDRAYPVRDADGVVRRVAGAASDVTHRRQLEQRLEESQAQIAVGRLALDVAHDLNNMLGIIQVSGGLFASDPALSPDAREGIDAILEASRRAAELSRQVLSFGTRHFARSNAEPASVDLGETTERLVRMMRRVLGRGIVLDCRVAPSLPRMRASASLLDQVTMNLIVNARDAMPGGGTIKVSVDIARDADSRRPPEVVSAVRWLCLRVEDTGEGIPPATLGRIFEPFFSTKGATHGTGLGLAMVADIARSHGGWVEVESQPGAGSVFQVFLPGD